MVEFGAVIGDSFKWTKKVLFNPFSFKKWLILAFVAWLAGAMANGCNYNSGSNRYSPPQEEQSAEKGTEKGPSGASRGTSAAAAPAPMPPAAKGIMITTIAAIVAFILILFLLFSWLGCRFSFVFLDDVVRNDASVKAPFGATSMIGNSLFKFNLTLMFIYLTLFGLIAYAAITIGMNSGLFSALNTPDPEPKYVFELLGLLLPFILLVIALSFVAAFIALVTVDFVVPIMYKEGIRILAGWGKAWALLKKNVGNLLVYILIKMGLGIGAAIAYTLAFLVAFIVMIIPFGLIVAALYFLSLIIPYPANVIYWIAVICILIPVFLFMMYLLISIGLPIAVFFRTYSVKFLGKLDPQYDLINIGPETQQGGTA